MSATDLTGELDARAGRRSRLFVRFLRRPLGVVSLVVFAIVLLVAIFAPWLAPQDPNLVDLAITKAPPSAAHWLGGDSAGRDILSRLIVGTRTTLWGALVSVVTAVVLGVPTGMAAGYFGGRFDRAATWVSDALQSIPGMVILLVVAAGTGSNFEILMFTVGVFIIPGYFRISRSITMDVRGEAYIDAARVAGLGDGRIIFGHITKAVWAPVIIQTALTAGMAMGIQAGLQFLGIGNANIPNWGAMMNEGFHLMLTNPLILLWPSLALGITIAVLALMGSTLAELVRVQTPQAKKDKALARKARRGVEGVAVVTPEDVRPEPAVLSTGTLRHLAENSAVRVDNLKVTYATAAGLVEVVHGISLDVAPGEVVGIVGESGSGKSQTVFSILGLLPDGGAAAASGIWIGGEEVTALDRASRDRLLGTTIGYIPQEPMSNLDPAYTIGQQLIEPLCSVHGMRRSQAKDAARAMLLRVGIADPDRVMRSHPHEISGGMAQRVLIAGAIAGKPQLLVADEPTTALDVTVQAEVLELLRELQQEYGMALLIVTHNFGVVADICDQVVVMRHGQILETGDVEDIFSEPDSDYTRELIAASLDDSDDRVTLDAQWARKDAGADAVASTPLAGRDADVDREVRA